MMSGMLEIDDVFTAYDKADVLQGVSLSVQPGSITCLLGSNGSGKTTLVRSILGLTPARAGRIVFNGTDITRLATHKVIAAGIACIPEGRKVFPKLTVEENLRVGAYQEPSDKVTQSRMADIFRIFPRLAERRIQLAGTMSGGEQAMVSIGRGLMCAPKLLLIDEPSLGLSPRLVKRTSILSAKSTSAASPCCWSSKTCIRRSPSRTLALSYQKAVWRRAGRRQNLQVAVRCVMLISVSQCHHRSN